MTESTDPFDVTPSPPEETLGETASPWRSLLTFLRSLLETIVPALVIALVINLFLAQATQVQGQSMEPTLHSQQRLVVEKITYRFHGPRRGDIVVLRVPQAGPEMLIKRVVGLPGETVLIKEGHLYINGQRIQEPYLPALTGGQDYGPVEVPPLHIFVLGDNRSFSRDSRSFGPVPIENVVGRAWFSYWPPEVWGPLK
ncbi:MAG: signal peptidase I [Chloroflexi bacterium]|nr:MAG: signal peptidase I [Chloroflexota bacterium]